VPIKKWGFFGRLFGASAATEPTEAQPNSSRCRADGRIKVEAAIVHNSQGHWFLPGAGKKEWFQDISGGPEMVVVPAGSFMMGSPDKEPERLDAEGSQHKVNITEPMAIARHAVTLGQFAAFVDVTGRKMNSGDGIFDGSHRKYDPSISWRDPGFAQDDRHPVVRVSWEDAQAYAKWLRQQTSKAYRLPTEAEWEYVCRAGTVTPFWWGGTISPAQANYDGDYAYEGEGSQGKNRKRTVPVESFDANPWGLYQVHGNVWEWCEDVSHDNYNGAPADGIAWLTDGASGQRVLRGGPGHTIRGASAPPSAIGAPRTT
jgi:formylglycine-generating enzyme required for sulfatase activity